MAIIISESANKPRKLIPAGTHIGILTQCIHLGMQDNGYGPKDRVRLGFEIPSERVTYTDNNGAEKDSPAMIGGEYTLTLGTAKKPSKLRKLLENWRGRAFTDMEAKSFDMAILLGKVCMVGVVHTERNGNMYADVSGVMACPKGVATSLKPEGDVIEYSPEAHDEATFQRVPQWLREKIEKRIKKEAPAPKPTGPMDHPPGEPFNDDIPFGNEERGVVSEAPAW